MLSMIHISEKHPHVTTNDNDGRTVRTKQNKTNKHLTLCALYDVQPLCRDIRYNVSRLREQLARQAVDYPKHEMAYACRT